MTLIFETIVIEVLVGGVHALKNNFSGVETSFSFVGDRCDASKMEV